MIQDQNNWLFGEPCQEVNQPLIKRIMKKVLYILLFPFFLIGILFFAGMMGRIKREKEMQKKYKKKIVDTGFFTYSIWEQRK